MFLQCIMAIAAFEHQGLTPTPVSEYDRFAPPAHWWLLVRHCFGTASTVLKWQDRVKKAEYEQGFLDGCVPPSGILFQRITRECNSLPMSAARN